MKKETLETIKMVQVFIVRVVMVGAFFHLFNDVGAILRENTGASIAIHAGLIALLYERIASDT